MKRLHVSPALAVALLALVLAASSGAYAAASSSARRISVCVHHRGGGLYSARHCARHDHRVSWNTVGPQGAAGPAGPQGTAGARGLTGLTGNTGDPGARGPSDAYIATAAGATTTGPESVTVVVPAGDYSAWAQALVSGTYSNPALGQCTLDATGQGSPAHSSESKGYVPAQFGTEPGEVELPAATVFHLPSGGTIRYDCQGSTTSYATLSLTWSNLQITATQVGTAHG